MEPDALTWGDATRLPNSTRLDALREVGTAVLGDTYRLDWFARCSYALTRENQQPLAYPSPLVPSAPLSFPSLLPEELPLACPPGLDLPPSSSPDCFKEDSASVGSTAD